MGWKDLWNKFPGVIKFRNETHIANAYEESDHCKVTWSTKKQSVKSIEAQAKADGNAKGTVGVGAIAKVEMEDKTVKQSVRVKGKGDPHKIYRRQSNENIYVTVQPMDKDGNPVGPPICTNYEVGHNRSFIITKEGSIAHQAMGEDLWQDVENYDHEIKKYVQD